MKRTLALVSVIAVGVAGRGYAQPTGGAGGPASAVALVPKFVPSQSARYALEAEFSRRRGPGPDDPGSALKQRAEFRVNTMAVAPDGTASMRLVFERLRAELIRYGPEAGATTWTWEEGEESGTTDGPEVAGFAEACLALAKSTVEINVEPDGWVKGVDGLDRAFAAGIDRRAREKPPAPLLGVFDPGTVEHTLSSLWAVGPGGGEVVRAKAGDSWRVVRRAPFIGAYQAEATTNYVLERLALDRAEIGGDVRYAVIPPGRDVDPAAPLPRITDQTGRVAVAWDLATGRVVSRRVERTLVWSATLQLEKPIEVRDYTSARLEIRLLD